MITQVFTIKPYFTVFLYTFEFNKYLSVRIFTFYQKMFPVPTEASPPVRVISFRGISYKRMHFTSGFVGAPGMRDAYNGPFGIIKARCFVSLVCCCAGNIIECPLRIDYLFNPAT